MIGVIESDQWPIGPITDTAPASGREFYPTAEAVLAGGRQRLEARDERGLVVAQQRRRRPRRRLVQRELHHARPGRDAPCAARGGGA